VEIVECGSSKRKALIEYNCGNLASNKILWK